MYLLRKLALFFLALPLTVNGLWMICPVATASSQEQASQQAQSSDADQQMSECEKFCARKSSLCLSSTGDKVSMTVIVFGVAIFPAQVQLGMPTPSSERIVDNYKAYRSPSIRCPSPPPET